MTDQHNSELKKLVFLNSFAERLMGPIILTKVEVFFHDGVFRVYRCKTDLAMKLADRVLGRKAELIREQMSWASGQSEYIFHGNITVGADEELFIEFDPPNKNASHCFHYLEKKEN